MKTKRPKVFVSQIVNQLQKYDRRIQQMAERAYKLRQMLETILKENQADATHITEGEGRTDSGVADRESGTPELDVVDAGETVLEK